MYQNVEIGTLCLHRYYPLWRLHKNTTTLFVTFLQYSLLYKDDRKLGMLGIRMLGIRLLYRRTLRECTPLNSHVVNRSSHWVARFR